MLVALLVIDLRVAAWRFRFRRASTLIQPAFAVIAQTQSPATENISSCGVCHQPGRHVRMRETAAAFRVGFSHAKHDRSEGLTCNECHRVRAGVARRLQVSAPQPLNHHASPGAFSCMSCHNGKRAFGGDDFSVCKRCHTGTRGTFDMKCVRF